MSIKSIFDFLFGWLFHKKSNPPVSNHPRPKGQLIGYSMPWSWNKCNPNNLANYLFSNGLNATLIEMDLWNTDPNFVATWIKPFRDRGITVEIIIINGNSTELLKNSDAWFNAIVDGLIAKVGYDHTILQPICEPGNSGGDIGKMDRWMNYAYSHWKGQTAVGDHWPLCQKYQAGRTYIEKHHCSDPNTSNMISGMNTTDCSPTLGMNPGRAALSTRAAIARHCNFILYDARNDPGAGSINVATIQAMGNEIK